MKKRLVKVLLEVFFICLSVFVVSMIANAISPRGIPYFPDLKAEEELKKQFPEIEPADVKGLVEQGSILIDARSEKYYKKSHIENAENIPYDDADKYYEEKLSYLPKDIQLIVYCNSEGCSQSLRMAKKLHNWDFTNIRIIKGGFGEWTKKKMPVISEEKLEK